MRFPASTPLLLLLSTYLGAAACYPSEWECRPGSCLCRGKCLSLTDDQTCCPAKNGHGEHICGPDKECCGRGCCREGWKCGSNKMCYPPPRTTSSNQSNCFTTVITIVKPVPVSPTTDIEISGTHTDYTVITTSKTLIEITSTMTLPDSTESGHHTISGSETGSRATSVIEVTNSDGQVSTIIPGDGTTGETSVPTSSPETPGNPDTTANTGPDFTITTNSDGQVSTILPTEPVSSDASSAVTDTNPNNPTTVTKSDGQVTTITPPETASSDGGSTEVSSGPHTSQGTESDVIVPTVITNSDGSESTIFPSETTLSDPSSSADNGDPTATESGATDVTNSDGEVSTVEPTDSVTITTNSDGEVSTLEPTRSDTVITNSDGQVSTLEPTDGVTITTNSDGEVSTLEPTDAASTITNSDGEVTTLIPTDAPTSNGTPTVITGSDGEVSTVVPTQVTTGEGTPIVTTGSDGQETTLAPTETVPSSDTDTGISTGTETESLTDVSSTDTFTNAPTNSASTVEGSSTGITTLETETSDGVSSTQPTDTEVSTETVEETTSSDAEQTTSIPSTDAETATTSPEVTSSNGQVDSTTAIPSEDVTTDPNEPTPTQEPTDATEQSPSVTKPPTPTTTEESGVIYPITTSVSEPGPSKIPCRMWFFFACIDIIQGWGITGPPGRVPPGPPVLSIDPKFPINININGKIPDWPEYTIGPDLIPTFSEKPDGECKTETAEICITSTSFGISVGESETKTTTSSTTATCGPIYGCDLEDSDATVTITSATTESTAEATGVIADWDYWGSDGTDEDYDEAADIAQSKIDAVFSSITTTSPPSTTTAPSTTVPDIPSTTRDHSSCNAGLGSDTGPTLVAGEGEFKDCRCRDGAWNIFQPFSRDQEKAAIDAFCNGSVIVAGDERWKSWNTSLSDTVHLILSAGFSRDKEGCQPEKDLVLSDYCREGFAGLTSCDWGKTEDETYGGTYCDNGDYGCVYFSITAGKDWSKEDDDEDS